LTDSTATECLLFPEIFAKPIVMEIRSAAGQFRWRSGAAESCRQRFGLISSMVDCLFDGRQAAKVDHPLKDLFAQRVFSIACGYPDANDSARLAADPIHKMLLDRDPLVGLDLASQPTLSRFENSLGPKQLYRLGESLAEERDRTSCQAVGWPRPARHHRSGSHRRSHARAASVCRFSTATTTTHVTCR